MITKGSVLKEAVNKCLEEIYSIAQPSVTFEQFKKECETYNNKYHAWERYYHLSKHLNELSENELIEYSSFPASWKDKSITECIGPRPYEFYYIPGELQKDIVDSYVYAYDIDKHQSLLDIIHILKDYCDKPIVNKYIEDYTDEYGNHHQGYRGYDHPDNIYKEIAKIVSNYSLEPAKEDSDEVVDLCNKFFEFLDMAGKFFSWNGELNNFIMSVWNISPNNHKQDVIDNWKQYRNKDIKINEEQIKEEYYGEELD